MFVRTPLIENSETNVIEANVITVDALVDSVLNQIGTEIETYGALKHDLHANIILSLPNFILTRLLKLRKN